GIRLSNDEVKLSTQFTNKDMANMIGSSRETVSRTLTQLKKKGFIQTAEDGHLILDIPLLKEELF
ncbi:MAG TPA: helix-turn-helix domain-containing protein, partial [Bacillota bacterium]|nr:helix-turn-helix domain-containing protein [Bacillota bacterium]